VTSPFIALEVEEEFRPEPGAFDFDLNRCLSSVLVLEATVGDDAYTAQTLGTERMGNAVVIGDKGLVLTIGYLITEADEVILTTETGRRIPAHILSVDPATGFGLMQALEPLHVPGLPIGDSRRLRPDEIVIAAGGGGRAHALAGQLLARGPFAGYWEYHLEDALFVGPDHPHWSGAALINEAGELVGVGSLRMEGQTEDGRVKPLNMFVPAELLPPILDHLAGGVPSTPPRPWLGVFAQDVQGRVVVVDVSADGPAARAELRRGDVIHAVAAKRVNDLGEFYKQVWALGGAGVEVPLTLQRGEDVFDMVVRSGDRAAKLKKRRLN
jgi:S1-C subfamily serine protease